MSKIRTLRFKLGKGWSRWYTGDEDFSFLKDNKEIEAMEVHELMTKEEAEKYLQEFRS